MSPPVAPSLHRFVPRRALETTAFGYEVIARNQCLDDCIATVQWIDCWCPDAAQFILVEASDDLRSETCGDLIRAIGESHLRPKIRLVCSAHSLIDAKLLAILRRRDIGFLLLDDGHSELEPLAQKGILGVRVDARTILRLGTGDDRFDARQLVSRAHDLGLRSIASQLPTSEDVRSLLAMGFDYVSPRDGGFIPAEPSFAWQGRVV
jgi:EAL domain-containing protein (putative c-di-GMP-specific phosphodiesterase class I)